MHGKKSLKLMCRFLAPIYVVLCFLSSTSFAEKIQEISVYENSKTTDATVLYLADIEIGDDFTTKKQDRVRLDLISSGLFKEVSVFSEPFPKGGVKVTILAKDKHSWIIAPTFYNQPTNRGVGVGFGENNLFGQNKKLLVYGQVATGDSFFVGAYVDPSIAQTRFHWQLDTFLRNERIFEYAAPSKFLESPAKVRQSKLRYLNIGSTVGLTFFRRVTFDARMRGAYVFYNEPELTDLASIDQIIPGGQDGDPIPKPGKEGWDISTEGVFKFDNIANYFGVASGTRVQFNYEKSLPSLGSEFDYWKGTLGITYAKKYFERHNLIVKGFGGYGKDLPFQQEFTSGGTALRGYENRQFRGDFKLSANAEYSMHLFSIPFPFLERIAVRGLGFFDSAYTTFLDIDDTDTFRNYLPGHLVDEGLIDPFRNSVGGGIRFYTRAVVLPLLGLDIGYGLESGEVQVYFAIGLTDF